MNFVPFLRRKRNGTTLSTRFFIKDSSKSDGGSEKKGKGKKVDEG